MKKLLFAALFFAAPVLMADTSQTSIGDSKGGGGVETWECNPGQFVDEVTVYGGSDIDGISFTCRTPSGKFQTAPFNAAGNKTLRNMPGNRLGGQGGSPKTLTSKSGDAYYGFSQLDGETHHTNVSDWGKKGQHDVVGYLGLRKADAFFSAAGYAGFLEGRGVGNLVCPYGQVITGFDVSYGVLLDYIKIRCGTINFQ